jgi:hypothetical protein
MPRFAVKIAILAIIATLLLGFGIHRAGVAAPFSDPVSGIRAQDETTYANSALTASHRGGWLTPKVLGRFYLVKPPLLIWLSGLSLKLFGVSTLALRLPVLIAGVLATVLLFLWAEQAHSSKAAIVAGLLLLVNPVWNTFSRICYTDMLLSAAMIAALFSLLRDPSLARRRTIVVSGICLAAGVMAKNVAGLLPLVILLLCFLITRKQPPVPAILQTCAVAALIIAPWHIYQLVSHHQWFLTDYVRIQLLKFGLSPPAQPSPEPHALFYLKRLVFTDPLLFLLAALGVPSLVKSAVRRKMEAALVLAWLLVAGAALFAFSYRNLPYLLYSIPPLCLVAAAYGPLSSGRRQSALIALVIAAFAAKVFWSGEYWGLSFGSPAPIPAAKWLRAYAEMDRPSELILVSPDDEFYAATLPLPGVRYCFIDPAGVARNYAPHYAELGITVTAAQFAELDRWRPRFRERLSEWGLDSGEPIATTIVAESESDVLKAIASRPHSDFYLPASFRTKVAAHRAGSHRIFDLSPERFFLLALDPGSGEGHARLWQLPTAW